MSGFASVDPGWPRFSRLTLPPAVRAGNLLFLSGMTAVDDGGNLVGKGDSVRTTDSITTTEGCHGTAAVRREAFGDRFPAATGAIVAGLLSPGALIEIEAIAVIA